MGCEAVWNNRTSFVNGNFPTKYSRSAHRDAAPQISSWAVKHQDVSSFFLKSVGKKAYKATKGAGEYEEMG